MTADSVPGRPFSRYIKTALLIAVLVGAALLSRFVDLRASALEWIEAQGPLGAAMFVALYVAATVLAFPASLLTWAQVRLGRPALYAGSVFHTLFAC